MILFFLFVFIFSAFVGGKEFEWMEATSFFYRKGNAFDWFHED